MWPFESQETRKIKRIVKDVADYIVGKFKSKGLISLYLGGTILTIDRTVYSDIDIYGIVGSNFDINKEEATINAEFCELKNSLFGGYEVRFRALGIDELEGGQPRGLIGQYINTMIRKFPYMKHLWGERLDFTLFKPNPISAKLDAEQRIAYIRNQMNAIRKGSNAFPYRNLAKQVMHLIALEAEKEYGFKYDPSYTKLTKHLMKQEGHIVHIADALRQKEVSREEILTFCEQVDKYIADLNERIQEWS